MKILFVHQSLMSFVQKDLNILQSAYQVRDLQFRELQDIPALVSGTLWADLTFSWFGKLHAFFAVLFSKMLGKKAIVVAGGDDVAYEPEINYGMFAYWWKRWCPLFVFRYADLILSVSESNRKEIIRNAKADPGKVELIYHGFDAQKWQIIDGIRKEKLVLTVGRITEETLPAKGLELFVRSAAYLVDVSFVLVGPSPDGTVNKLKAIASSNVTFTGVTPGEELLKMYSRAKVYVQVSVHESFGCSLAEAMLCECIPVVSRKAAIPEVVGNCGFYIEKLEPEDVAEKIKEALSVPEDLGKKARERIITLFPLEKRKKELFEAVESVLTK